MVSSLATMVGPRPAVRLVEITAVHYRNNPILTNALMADYPSNEQSGFFSIIRSARIWDDLDRLGVPGIQGVYAHPAGAGGFGMTVIGSSNVMPAMQHRHWRWQRKYLAAPITRNGSSLSMKTLIPRIWTRLFGP